MFRPAVPAASPSDAPSAVDPQYRCTVAHVSAGIPEPQDGASALSTVVPRGSGARGASRILPIHCTRKARSTSRNASSTLRSQRQRRKVVASGLTRGGVKGRDRPWMGASLSRAPTHEDATSFVSAAGCPVF